MSVTDILSIQLYTLRSLEDLDLILDTVADAGYRNVETVGSHLDKAAEVLHKVIQLSPEAPEPALNYGVVLLQQRKYGEAEAQLRDAVKKNDHAFTAHFYFGIALIHVKNYAEAETELRRAITIGGPKVGHAHYYLGGMYWQTGKNQQAADELELFLKLEPKAWLSGKDVYVIEGKPAKGPAEKLFFDVENGLLLRWDMARKREDRRTVWVKIHFDDYRDVGRVKLPFKMRFAFEQFNFNVQVNEVEHNIPIDDAIFKKPS